MIRQRKPIKRKTPLRRSTKRIRARGRKADEWEVFRRHAIAKYTEAHGWVCQWCGREMEKGGLDLHHKTKRSLRGQHTEENCIALCNGFGGCHARAHASRQVLETIKDSSISLAKVKTWAT